MGTRGAFGVIIGEKEKLAYNHFDSYPDGKGIEVLRWLRNVIEDDNLDVVRKLAEEARVVGDETPPTDEDKARLKGSTDLSVAGQSEDDWYCLLRGIQGDLQAMLESGYIYDAGDFPLDSLFCEWGYIVDLDRNVFEVYQGFQAARPKRGRWKGRPTAKENEANYKAHLEYAKKVGREPWREKTPDYKAIELIASWPLDALPSDEHFLACTQEVEEATV